MKNLPMQWRPFGDDMPAGVYCVVLVPNEHGALLPYIAVREIVCGQSVVRYWTDGASPRKPPTHWLKLPRVPT